MQKPLNALHDKNLLEEEVRNQLWELRQVVMLFGRKVHEHYEESKVTKRSKKKATSYKLEDEEGCCY